MRKKDRQLVAIGLVFLFGIVAYAVYAGWIDTGGWFDFSFLNSNNTDSNSTTYNLAVSNLQATVLENGHVNVSFSLTNEDQFNISSIYVAYALNVADPQNASYTEIAATKDNTTYTAEIPSSFGDTVYYKVRIIYDVDKILETDVYTIQVTDTVSPTVSSLTIDYNATTGNATVTVNATDNDALDSVTLYYVVTTDGNTTEATFSNVTLTAEPYVFTITVDDNTGDATYYYLDVYVEAEDLSGNTVRYPAEGTVQLYANETKAVSG